MNDDRITLHDGRSLAFKEVGDPGGIPVIHFHGAPSCRKALDFLHEEFAERGLRVISPDRPGYGRSSPLPGRSLDDWPTDVAELADALDIDQFATLGLSSGGPYALVTCARLGERVRTGVVVAGAGDPGIPGTVSGLPEIERQLMELPDKETAVEWCVDRFGKDGSRFFDHEPFKWAEPDVEFLEDETLSVYFEEVTEESFRQGVIGFAHDMNVQGQPWPFELADIDVPVRVLHGEKDEVVPVSHSRNTVDGIPRAKLVLLSNHGHASPLPEFPTFVDDALSLVS